MTINYGVLVNAVINFIVIALAVFVFVVSSVIHMATPMHRGDLKKLPKVVTEMAFNQALQTASEEVFPGEPETQDDVSNNLKVRVLNQLSEELIIAERAKDLVIDVTDAELDKAVAAIKADYPDNTFEETLLENAVSFDYWKKRLATRLLVEKVIDRELVDQVNITPEDVADYYQSHYAEGTPEDEDPDTINERIVVHLRRQKAEKAYKQWIEELRKLYPVEINRAKWERIIGAKPE